MERNDYLIRKKFYAYLIPGVMMVAALQLGNLMDSVFVGNILGMKALSASSIGMPVVFLAQVPMMIFAVGGSTVSAVYLGRGDMKKASGSFRIAFFGTLVFNAANAAASFIYAAPLARLLTLDSEMADMCATFMSIYLIGLPVIGCAMVAGYFMGVDNHPKESAAMHITANIINLVLDYIFLQIMHTGIAGSVYSTIIGYTVSGLIFSCIYLRSKKRMLRLFKPRESLLKPPDEPDTELPADTGNTKGGLASEVIKTGAASGILMLLNAVRIIVLNSAVINMTGADGMAIYAVSVNSMFLVQLCLHGVVGVIPAIGGILFGDRDHYGIRQLLKRVSRLCVIISILLMALFILAPVLIGAMFGYTGNGGGAEMELCLRLFALSFVFYAFNIIMQSYYPAVQKAWYANFNTILQGFALLIPLTLLFILAMGVAGTGLASAFTEAFSFVIVALLIRSRLRSGREEGTDLTLIPEPGGDDCLDITVKGTVSDAAGIAHRIVEYCTGRGIEKRIANAAGIAAEELVDNIAVHSGKDGKISFIDIRLAKTEDKLILRVRDDGGFFDPTAYIKDKGADGDGLDIGGLRLILSLAEKVDYSRVLDMNNTVVEVAADGR